MNQPGKTSADSNPWEHRWQRIGKKRFARKSERWRPGRPCAPSPCVDGARARRSPAGSRARARRSPSVPARPAAAGTRGQKAPVFGAHPWHRFPSCCAFCPSSAPHGYCGHSPGNPVGPPRRAQRGPYRRQGHRHHRHRFVPPRPNTHNPQHNRRIAHVRLVWARPQATSA